MSMDNEAASSMKKQLGNSHKKKSMKRMFFSGHRVTEIKDEDDVALDQSLSSESSSQSSVDFFDQGNLDDIQLLLTRKREHLTTGSITFKFPDNLIKDYDEARSQEEEIKVESSNVTSNQAGKRGNKSSSPMKDRIFEHTIQVNADSKSDQDNFLDQQLASNRFNIFEFDLNAEVRQIINHYYNKRQQCRRYTTTEIQHLNQEQIQQAFGHIHQYVFEQHDIPHTYKIKLSNFRRLMEGAKIRDLRCQDGSGKFSKESDYITEFFSDLDVEVVQHLDPNNKLIRIQMKRKYSVDFNEFCSKDTNLNLRNQISSSSSKNNVGSDKVHTMLLNYSVMGHNQDRASITLIEFDEKLKEVNPYNFVII